MQYLCGFKYKLLTGNSFINTTAKRQYCDICKYPQPTCVCEHIQVLDTSVQVSIMQDPSETRHAKNTARLIPLIIPHCDIYVGETEPDFAELIDKLRLHPSTLLLYPSANAIEMASNPATSRKNDKSAHISGNAISSASSAIAKGTITNTTHIVLLDGTWRKAKKLYLANSWLHSIQTGVLSGSYPSMYQIRKRPFSSSYSTIEALAYALQAIDNTPIEPFIEALEGLQSSWRKFDPK